MAWFKQHILAHWFGFLVTMFLILVTAYFVVVFVSPRYDLQKRGFIPCTEQMATQIATCSQSRISCTFGAIWENNICDLKVIVQGWQNWRMGSQPRPWSNYLFEPETLTDDPEDDPALQNFFQENPDLDQEMQKLKLLNKDLEANEQTDE